MRKDGREAMAVVAVLSILSTGMACILSNDGSSVSAANDVYTHETTNLTVGQYASGILVQYEEITTNGGCAADNTYTGSIPGITFTAANGSFGYSGTPTQAGSYAVTIGVTGFMSYQYNEFPFVVSEATADTEYTISFSNTYGSASPQSQSADYGQYISLPDPGTRTGYTFDGWYTSSTGGTNVGGSGSSYKVTSSLTLYALWKQVYTHTIIYSSNDGSGAMTNTVVTDYNSGASAVTLAENTYTKDGHTFTGWSINGTVYQPGSTYSVNGNASVTATAQWQQNEITIHELDTQYAMVNKSMSFNAGADISPSRDITYSVSDVSNGLTVTVSGSAITVSSTTAGTYTFTLTASATNYPSDSTTVTVIVDPVLSYVNSVTIGKLTVKGA